MKIFCALLLLLVAVYAMPQDKYTTKYDHIDIDSILNNKKLISNYIGCLLDENPCTPDGAELKRVLPEALETECAKCSDKQREIVRKVFNWTFDHNDDGIFYKKLEEKYDPDGNYRKRFCEIAMRDGIDTKGRCPQN